VYDGGGCGVREDGGMTGRERVRRALAHQETDRVPIDFGATATTGMAASAVAGLRRALGIAKPGERVKVVEPYQMLGEVDADLRRALGIDTVGLFGRTNLFGFENADWKPWTLFDGTPVLVPGNFNTVPAPNGDVLMYPQGDREARPSGRMPRGGYYFDSLIRQPSIDDARLNVADNLEEFGPLSDADLTHLEREADRLYRETDLAIVAVGPGTAFGDIALVPGPFMKDPKGIRDVEEWYVSTVTRRAYIREVFDRQCEIALGNLELMRQAVGDRIDVLFTTGTDFGTQRGPFISPDAYRDLYQPFHRRVNDWVHKHTAWRTLMHSCGGIEPLLPDIIDAGFDVLNPVQCSAAGMDPQTLKARYGARLTFWGAGVDTQRTLPFGTPEAVRAEVRERLRVFGAGGGFVFNAIHNVQANTPVENLLAMVEALRQTE
jgi:hypothetical protein